uniref:Uncharacterized protein n=1 Tax=Siphoviridae sp. ctmHK36 TaxID=2827931 RepID=A0A8S5TCE7_9CAUD|nr:MAG TPA: hypothetical protein [Siphoviridae sp. ctmHK36]
MENLEDIKVGDKVILANARIKRVVTVTKVTKTQIVIGNKRFKKESGFEYGGRPLETKRIYRATPEVLEEIEAETKRNDLINKIARYPWGSLTNEELEKVCKIINK